MREMMADLSEVEDEEEPFSSGYWDRVNQGPRDEYDRRSAEFLEQVGDGIMPARGPREVLWP